MIKQIKNQNLAVDQLLFR